MGIHYAGYFQEIGDIKLYGLCNRNIERLSESFIHLVTEFCDLLVSLFAKPFSEGVKTAI